MDERIGVSRDLRFLEPAEHVHKLDHGIGGGFLIFSGGRAAVLNLLCELDRRRPSFLRAGLSPPGNPSSMKRSMRCFVFATGGSVSPSRRCRAASYTWALRARRTEDPVAMHEKLASVRFDEFEEGVIVTGSSPIEGASVHQARDCPPTDQGGHSSASGRRVGRAEAAASELAW
jgi:hypothetical protein